jgi:hypothetical protein
MMTENLKTIAKNYLIARKTFLEIADKTDWLIGNDNLVGRIGEFIAYMYLKEQNRNPIRPKIKTEKGYDFICDNNKTKISVKTITHENKAGRTTRISEPWDELILITINEEIQIEKFGILTKKEFKNALDSNFLKSKNPYARRTMVGEKGLISNFGRILPKEKTDKYF